MTLPALDLEPRPATPSPEGAIAPPSGDGAAEPAPAPEAASAKRSGSEAAPAKPPAASLVSIALKGKASGPTKTGDLSRLFELARRQAPAPTTPSAASPAESPQPPAGELKSAAQPVLAVPPPVEVPLGEAASATSLDAAPSPIPLEAAVSVEPMTVSEVALEPSVPRMLGPPMAVQIEDAMDPALGDPATAPTPEAALVDLPDWDKAATAGESDLASETPEPLKVALAPMPEPAPEAETPDTAQADDQPPAVTASTTTLEPTQAPAALRPEAEPPQIAVAPVERSPAPAPAVPPAPVFKELVDYWRSLRSGDDHPAAEAIDRDLVTQRWPGTLLIAYTPASQDPRGELRPGRVIRLGTACAETQSAVDAGSHSTEWMLEVARTALINDEAVEEQQRLSTVKGEAGFRMVALPLGPRKGLANAVLCTLAPSPGAPRFGTRRIWL